MPLGKRPIDTPRSGLAHGMLPEPNRWMMLMPEPNDTPIELPEPVAGGGLLDRRYFLRQSLTLGAGAGAGLFLHGNRSEAAELQPWTRTPGLPFSNYGQPSPSEKRQFAGFQRTRKPQGTASPGRPCTDWREQSHPTVSTSSATTMGFPSSTPTCIA